jgi:hypothetical protein
MKKLFIAAIMLFSLNMSIQAQSVVKEGNTFKCVTKSSKKDTLVTSFKFEDSKGKSYPIIINKANGHCYVWRVSQKTGKPYPQPMKEEISIAVCKELGIKYVPKKTKK